jgi:hypothetical protein
MCVGGGATKLVRGRGGATCKLRGGGATTHISTESSDEASSKRKGGGAVRQWLELPTSCIREGEGAVWWRLKLSTSWCEGGGAVPLEEEASLL